MPLQRYEKKLRFASFPIVFPVKICNLTISRTEWGVSEGWVKGQGRPSLPLSPSLQRHSQRFEWGVRAIRRFFINNARLFFNKARLIFNKAALFALNLALFAPDVPLLGTIYSQLGNNIFPAWEQNIPSVGIIAHSVACTRLFVLWASLEDSLTFYVANQIIGSSFSIV